MAGTEGLMTMGTKRVAVITAAAAVIVVVGAVVAFGATTSSSSYGSGMIGGRYVYRPAQPTQVHTLAGARSQAQHLASRLGLRVDEVLQFKRNFYVKLVDSHGNGATEVLVDPSSGVVSIEYGPAMMWNTRYGMGRAAQSMMGSYGRGMMGAGGYRGMMGASSDSSSSTGTYGPGMMGGAGAGDSGMMGGNAYAPDGTGSSGSSTAQSVSLATAHSLAQRWLDGNEPGVKVETGGDAVPGYYTLETLKGGRITGMISVNATTGAVWPHWWHGGFVAKSE
jgi:hypothetical protein